MGTPGWILWAVFCGAVGVLHVPMGAFMHRVLVRAELPWGRAGLWLDRWGLRAMGVSPDGQTWRAYAESVVVFSAVSVLFTHAIQRLQAVLPGNPQQLPGVEAWSSFNTAVSFVTNTNWQGYAGETTMGHLVQAAALGWNNFLSAAVGLAVALAVARGLTGGATGALHLGNFWQDVWRALVFVLLPLSLPYALFLVSRGVVQTWAADALVHTLEGAQQWVPLGPVATQEAVKMLGTNGGGFFNANSAHPFENPDGLTNLVQMVSIFLIPAGLTHTWGLMAGDARQGRALLASMACLFALGGCTLTWAESQPNAAVAHPWVQAGGNLEGKEVRFGVEATALFATVTTDASCGAVNGMHGSFNALGGLVPLVNIQLGEVVFGGVGAGLVGMLMMVLLAVFLAGLMVGRTPEFLGRKVEPREMTLVTLYVLVFPVAVLVPSAVAVVLPDALASLGNAGPHGFSELLYAFTSAAGNNGSAMAGLGANTWFFNVTTAVAMWVGRFCLMVPALALAGSMARKKAAPPGPGTFPTHGPLFVALLTAVIVLVGALTFVPALVLGPVVEHFLALHGRVF